MTFNKRNLVTLKISDPDPFTTTFYQDPVFLVDSDTGYITLKELREMNYD